jgi:membrane associated rhomboid family serine protease
MAWHERDYYREPAGGGGFGGGGGSFGRGFGGGKLSITMWLLIINVVVFLLDAVLAGGSRTPWWLVPSNLGAYNVATGLESFQIWRFVTYQFLHGGFFHILFNMIVLYFFGPLMEQWWGSRRYLAFYLICGVSGAVLYTLMVLAVPNIIFDIAALKQMGMTPAQVPIVGASGAIFGLLIGAAVLFPHQRVMLLIPPIPMSLRTLAIGLLVIAALSVLVGTQNAGGEAAHLGGAALGYLFVRHPNWLDWADSLRFKAKAPTGRLKQKLAQAQQAQKQREDKEVDRILGKVRNQGLQSLTRQERKTLNRATERHNKPD